METDDRTVLAPAPPSAEHPPARLLRRLGPLSLAAAAWSGVCAALGLWWTLDPGAYPLGAGASGSPAGLLGIVSVDAAAAALLRVGLLGVVLALLLGVTGPRTPGRRTLLAAGGLYAVVFGLLLPDVQLLSFLGYALALTGPLVVVGLLVAGARRHPRNLLVLAVVAAAGTIGVLTGHIGGPTVQMLRDIRDGAATVGPRPLYLVLLVAGGVLFAALTAAAARRGRATTTTPEARARLERWGRAATWVAALCPMPYALLRLTWLTPWPQGAPGGPDAIGDGVRVFGILLGLAALGGAVLTVGLVSRWGEVFPAWLPGLRGRPVPVLAAVVPATVVAVVLSASAVSMVMLSTTDGAGWIVAAIPAPLWGPALGLATYAYYRRRTDPLLPDGPEVPGPARRR